jgi:hypothetical protein
VFLVSGFESAVFCVGERSLTFAPRFFEERGAVCEGGADVSGGMGAGVWVVPLVCVGEVSAEPEAVLVRSWTKENNVPVFEIDC